MILRRITEHLRAQNWLAVGLDFVIVVSGVLLALWLNEWSQGRAERSRDQLAEQAVRDEMLRNLGSLQAWRAMNECHGEQLKFLRDQLLASNGKWPGIQRRAVYSRRDEGRVVPGFYALQLGGMSDAAWKAAVASGAVDRMEPEKRALYGSMSNQFARINMQMEGAYEARSRMGALVYPGNLSTSDRIEALNQVILLDNAREYIGRDRDFSAIQLSREEFEQFERYFDRSQADMASIGTVRPCYTKPSLPPSVRIAG